MAKIFLSYQREQESTVKALVADLETLGHRVWFDHQISGGQQWWEQILEQIRQCDLFVFGLDSKSLSSTPCQREYAYAGALKKHILPVLLADGVSPNLLPPELSAIQFIDYRKPDRTAALLLARAINVLPAMAPVPDPVPVPPEIPLSYTASLAIRIESAERLSDEAQRALLLDLKQGLRENGTSPDCRKLLEKFRNRPEILASIHQEIGEALQYTPRPTAVTPAGDESVSYYQTRATTAYSNSSEGEGDASGCFWFVIAIMIFGALSKSC